MKCHIFPETGVWWLLGSRQTGCRPSLSHHGSCDTGSLEPHGVRASWGGLCLNGGRFENPKPAWLNSLFLRWSPHWLRIGTIPSVITAVKLANCLPAGIYLFKKLSKIGLIYFKRSTHSIPSALYISCILSQKWLEEAHILLIGLKA